MKIEPLTRRDKRAVPVAAHSAPSLGSAALRQHLFLAVGTGALRAAYGDPTSQKVLSRKSCPCRAAIGASEQMFGALEQMFGAS